MNEQHSILLNELQKKIGYRFNNIHLLRQALTHRSHVHNLPDKESQTNERMEYLGDAILGFLISDILYHKFSSLPEGKLSRLRSILVNESTLAKKAEQLQLSKYLLLAPQEIEVGTHTLPSVIADAYEALIAAIYLDSDIATTRNFVIQNFDTELNQSIHDRKDLNYKSILQEYTQSKTKSRPRYKTIKENGPEHRKIYTVQVSVDGKILGIGKGRTKKNAAQLAAKQSLEKLGIVQGGRT